MPGEGLGGPIRRGTTDLDVSKLQEYLDAVEELRGLQRPIPTKSDVIRELVMEALKRAKAKGKR